MCLLGTFAHHTVVNEASCIKIDKDVPLDRACLLGCGVVTGWGSARVRGRGAARRHRGRRRRRRHRLQRHPGRQAGRRQADRAIDPVEFKREKAMEFGATHTFASIDEALPADHRDHLGPDGQQGHHDDGRRLRRGCWPGVWLAAKGGRVVVTNIHPALEMTANVSLLDLTLMEKQLVGSLFGSANPRDDIPMLLELYRRASSTSTSWSPRRTRSRRSTTATTTCAPARTSAASWCTSDRWLTPRRSSTRVVCVAFVGRRARGRAGRGGARRPIATSLLGGSAGHRQDHVAARRGRRARLRVRVRRGQRRADARSTGRPLRSGPGAGRRLRPRRVRRRPAGRRRCATARCCTSRRSTAIPEETLNVLITVMSERELHVPRLGRVVAAPGFRLVAAMNPFDAVGTARISSAVYDRVCRLARRLPVGRRGGGDRQPGRGPAPTPAWVEKVVEVVRLTREHPDVRIGSSVRGAIDTRAVAASLAAAARAAGHRADVGLDAAIVALSGRVRVREGARALPRTIVTELWARCSASRTRPTGRRATGKARPRRGPPPPEGPRRRGRRAAGRSTRPSGDDVAPRARPQPRFDRSRREVGELDEARSTRRSDDPDEALALLADLAGDRSQAARAGPPSGRPAVPRPRPRGPGAPRGIGRIVAAPYRPDRRRPRPRRQLDAIAERRRRGRPSTSSGCGSGRGSSRRTALCLLVDRSGSMGGKPLATPPSPRRRWPAARPTTTASWRSARTSSSSRPRTATGRTSESSTTCSRCAGHGTTDLAGALRVAGQQLAAVQRRAARSRCCCRTAGRPTGDVLAAAGALDELAIIAPAGDAERRRPSWRHAGARSRR